VSASGVDVEFVDFCEVFVGYGIGSDDLWFNDLLV